MAVRRWAPRRRRWCCSARSTATAPSRPSMASSTICRRRATPAMAWSPSTPAPGGATRSPPRWSTRSPTCSPAGVWVRRCPPGSTRESPSTSPPRRSARQGRSTPGTSAARSSTGRPHRLLRPPGLGSPAGGGPHRQALLPLPELFALDWEGFVRNDRLELNYAAAGFFWRYVLEGDHGALAPRPRAFLAGIAQGGPVDAYRCGPVGDDLGGSRGRLCGLGGGACRGGGRPAGLAAQVIG